MAQLVNFLPLRRPEAGVTHTYSRCVNSCVQHKRLHAYTYNTCECAHACIHGYMDTHAQMPVAVGDRERVVKSERKKKENDARTRMSKAEVTVVIRSKSHYLIEGPPFTAKVFFWQYLVLFCFLFFISGRNIMKEQ